MYGWNSVDWDHDNILIIKYTDIKLWSYKIKSLRDLSAYCIILNIFFLFKLLNIVFNKYLIYFLKLCILNYIYMQWFTLFSSPKSGQQLLLLKDHILIYLSCVLSNLSLSLYGDKNIVFCLENSRDLHLRIH